MLGYAPPDPIPGQRPHPPLYWLLLWVAAWTLIGLFGHTPWRGDESVQLGLALDVLHKGHWLAPELGQLPWLETPPLAVWWSAAAIAALGDWLEPYDAARLPGLLALLLAFWALLRWSLPRLQRRDRWAAGLSLFGALSLGIPAHTGATELWTLAGFALLAAGLSRPERRASRTATLIATGLALASLAGGSQLWLAGVLAIAAVSVAAPQRSQHRAHLLGLVVGSMPLLVWAAMLKGQGLLAPWFATDPLLAVASGQQQPGGGLFAEVRGVLWSWPLWPLAAAALWQRRRNIRSDPRLFAPLALLVCAMLVWWLTPGAKDARALALLGPLALLSGPGLLRLERGQAQALNAFGIVLFMSVLGMLWLFWAAAHLGAPQPFAGRALRLLPSYDGSWSTWQVAAAAIATAAAVILVAGLRRSPLRPLLGWCIGSSVVWMLVILLGGHWLESRLSYQPLVRSLADHWPERGCVADSPTLRPGLVAAVRSFSRHELIRGNAGLRCPYVLAAVPRTAAQAPDDADVLWRGRWNADSRNHYVLYRRP